MSQFVASFIAFHAIHREVEAPKSAGVVNFLDPTNHEFFGCLLAVLPDEPGVGCQVRNTGGMVRVEIVRARAARGRGAGVLQRGAMNGESGISEAKEDEANHRLGVLGRRKSRIGAQLIRRLPEPLFQGAAFDDTA
jgi:hypothetical protein